jgi:hypothetical protein
VYDIDKYKTYELKYVALENGDLVRLVSWGPLRTDAAGEAIKDEQDYALREFEPTAHREKLRNEDWDQAAKKERPDFYEATRHYMHNDWANNNMVNAMATLGDAHVRLFFHPETDSWHTDDALDIDHKVTWKAHLIAKGAATPAEAAMVYNDVDNLRLVPASFNRGRDAVEAFINRHDPDSPELQAWVRQRFGYDPASTPIEYDPDVHRSRRYETTQQQEWTSGNQRSELEFDTNVREIWFEAELSKRYAGMVSIQHPDTGNTYDVPLFDCGAAGKKYLVTRSAFDIDHIIPIETLLEDMRASHPDGFSKADALDLYNRTDNLRLVARAGNASHEFEIDADGDWVLTKEEQKLYAKLNAPAEIERDRRFIDDTQGPDRQSHDAMEKEMYGRATGKRKRDDGDDAKSGASAAPDEHEPPKKRLQPMPVGVALGDSRHPDHEMFRQAWGLMLASEQIRALVPEPVERLQLAAALVLAARSNGMTTVARLVVGNDNANLFAIEHLEPTLTSRHAGVDITTAKQQPIADTTAQLTMVPHIAPARDQTPSVAEGGEQQEKPQGRHH